MTTLQKTIKYVAIAFAIYLSFMIISGIILLLTTILGVSVGIEALTDYSKGENTSMIAETVTREFEDIKSLDIALKTSLLEIKTGDTLKVEMQNITTDFIIEENNQTLKLEDKKNRWFESINNRPSITIYIPEGTVFDNVVMQLGVSETKIERLQSEKIHMEMGVGTSIIKYIEANSVKIKGGVGKSLIEDGQIGTLDLESGVGELNMTAKITNRADASSGIGRFDLNLKGNKEAYQINTDTGLGTFEVDGQKVSGERTIGDGMAKVKINAVIGKTTVHFIE